MELSPQCQKVAKVDAQWEEFWLQEPEDEADLTYKLQNPAGPLQMQLMEIEKVKQNKKYHEFWKKNLVCSLLGCGSWLVISKITKMNFSETAGGVMKILAAGRLLQFAKVAEDFFKESFANFKVVRWLFSATGGNQMSLLLSQMSKLTYIEMRLQDLTVKSNDVKRWLCQNINDSYDLGVESCSWAVQESWEKYREAKRHNKIHDEISWKEWKMLAGEALKFEVERLESKIENNKDSKESVILIKVQGMRNKIEIVKKLQVFVDTDMKIVEKADNRLGA